jgi:hypothetical protein
MSEPLLANAKAIRECWSRVVTSMMWNQWLMLDGGLRAAQTVLALAAAATGPQVAGAKVSKQSAARGTERMPEELIRRAEERMRNGLAPPREVYQSPYRDHVDWSRFPDWARPSDPDLFDGSGHEG